MDDRASLLGQTSLFEGLSPEDLSILGEHVVERRFKAGDIVFAQGDNSHSMYVVSDGQLNIYLPGEGSRRISLKDVARGEFFGELALFDDLPRSASVLSSTDSVLYELDRPTLDQYLDHRPRAAHALLRMMTQRLRATNLLLSKKVVNVNEEIARSLTWKDRLADQVAELNGSWSFVLALLGVTVVWTVVNSIGLLHATFDPYPYVFFNLVLAILVAMQGPLIVMSQNRQSMKDRKTTEAQYQVNLKSEVHIETILRELGEFRVEMNERLKVLERKS
jgi:CRP/FNR family transcriptional regulator, cyclic AMP receptor protein